MKKRKTAQNNASSTGVRGFEVNKGPNPKRKIRDIMGQCYSKNASKCHLYSVHYGWLINGEPRMYNIYMGSLGEAYKLWQFMVNGIDGIESYHIERVEQGTIVPYFYETLEDVLLGHCWYYAVNIDDSDRPEEYIQIEWLGGCKEVLKRSDIR